MYVLYVSRGRSVYFVFCSWKVDRAVTMQGQGCHTIEGKGSPLGEPRLSKKCSVGALCAPVLISCMSSFSGNALPRQASGRTLCAPTVSTIEFLLAPEGSNGEEAKSVKKRAALLHVLAFCFLDHIFGVPRGRAPWAGPPALSEVAGPFSVPFGVPKGTHSG